MKPITLLVLGWLYLVRHCQSRTAARTYLNPIGIRHNDHHRDSNRDYTDSHHYGGYRADANLAWMFGPDLYDGDNNGTTDDEGRIFRRWLNSKLRTYDKRVRPHYGQRPLPVKLGLWLIGISSVSEANMEFTVEMYMHEYWQDPRLTYDPVDLGNVSQLTLPLEAPRFLWLPDTSFLNALRSQNPESGSLSHLYYLKLYPDGTLFYSRRLSVTAECQMDLTMYPFDRQVCMLEISSYGLDVNDMFYEWTLHDKSVIVENIHLADFYAIAYSARVVNRTYVAGDFSVPQLCFVFQRRSGFCYAQLFIPATAVVASSWISLWLESETQFSDMVAVILAIIFLSYTYNTIMPRLSYVKAMDIYLGGCFMFVFISLVKLGVVKYMWKRMRKREGLTVVSNEAGMALLQPMQGVFTGQNAGGLAAVNAGIVFGLDGFGADALSRLNLVNNNELERMNGQSGKEHKRPSIPTVLKVVRVHDGYWKCAKAFHIGSQVLLPILFVSFAVFFFLVYARLYVPVRQCFQRN